jgi:hypothetical protein
MLTQSEFHNNLREWYSLNAILILNETLPVMERIQLLINRSVYSELFYAMEGILYDNLNK